MPHALSCQRGLDFCGPDLDLPLLSNFQDIAFTTLLRAREIFAHTCSEVITLMTACQLYNGVCPRHLLLTLATALDSSMMATAHQLHG
jgi:hypothetical protein